MAIGGNRDFGFAGGVRWESGFGAQLGWLRLADVEFASTVGNTTSFVTVQSRSLALVGSYTRKLNERLSISALLGVHRWSYSSLSSRDDPTGGLGLDYRINQNWSTGLVWQRFKTSSDHLDRSSVNLVWHF